MFFIVVVLLGYGIIREGEKRSIIFQIGELFLKVINNVVFMFKKGFEDGEKCVCFVFLKFNLYLLIDEQLN